MTNSVATAPSCHHVAIIMDGNGRWAKKRLLPRAYGHQKGIKALKAVVQAAINANISVLTLYAFSSENWRRPEEEVNFLMDLLHKTIINEFNELLSHNVRLQFIGQWQILPSALVNEIQKIIAASAKNTGLSLVIALNYGGRAEIVQAVKKLAQAVVDGELNIDQIDEMQVQNTLALHDLPQVDLLIRTSGELRLSNFLLWQLAYTEFYFSEVLWPDFGELDFQKALAAFYERQRRFGGL